ncbi:hypothetical protein [Paenibacillus agricola]|uniref:Uncharacterized protein n=1 Tax=Paenibacillus agricola TaxID=2716264 RepID=A0ABX0JJC2_9BACL|nr:hypothetical protein [Paenibacillus agricola]NHN34873.1 hypothetical protein [Paenibacillus agricola]
MNTIEETNIKRLQDAIASLEIARQLLYHQLSAMYPYEFGVSYQEALPVCQIKAYNLVEPVIEITFEGMLPLYFEHGDRKDHQREKYRLLTKEYYISAVSQAVKRQNVQTRFKEKVIIIIAHVFADITLRDLDNRNRKYLIDAVKLSQLIKDDEWKNVSLMDCGYASKDAKNYVQIYITAEKAKLDLIKKVDENNT